MIHRGSSAIGRTEPDESRAVSGAHEVNLNRYISKQFANPHGIGGRMVTAVMNRQNREMYEQTERFLRPSADEVILDIGCGNGFMMERLARTCKCHLIGVDISDDVLLAAKRNVGSISARFICCSVEKMPIESETVDKAITINTLYFWNDLQKGFEEIYRVLKPGGVFISTHYTNQALEEYPHTQYGYERHPQDAVGTVAREAGFSVKSEPIMQSRGYVLICCK